MIHELKTWPEYFEQVYLGHKNFELRRNDRDYQVGDKLFLREWSPILNDYTGRTCMRDVNYILHGGNFGLELGFCIMAID